MALAAGTTACASTDAAAAEFKAMISEAAAEAKRRDLKHGRDNAAATPVAGRQSGVTGAFSRSRAL